MSSIVNEFKVFHLIPENIEQNIKLFDIINSVFGICVTNDDKVYAFGEKRYINYYFGYKESEINNNYVLIRELCDQNIQQFFCFKNVLFARSSDNKIFSSGKNKFGQLARGYKSEEYMKPKRIVFFDNKNIIDISFGETHCLALSSEGLVYVWGHIYNNQFDKTLNTEKYLSPVLINSEFGVEKPIKHIHSCDYSSVLVSFDGFVYIFDLKELYLNYKLNELENVYKIYLDYKSAIILKNNGSIEYFSQEKRKTFEVSFEKLVNSHYLSEERELIIETNERILFINAINGEKSEFNHKNEFEYCLFRHHKTFKTIYLIENRIYYKSFEVNEERNSIIEIKKEINFNVEEYNNKYHNPNDSMSLKNFRISNTLPEILDSKVKNYHQIGENDSEKNSAIFVMNDNKVYAIGYNRSGVLGLGHERYVNEFTLIEELCDQNIEEFFEGKGFMFGRNNKNQIFSWGWNWAGQLARGYTSEEYLKPMKIEFFENKNIIEISFGFWHCLGLTENGVVYGWGDNTYGQTGNGSNKREELTPILIELSDCLDNRIKFIHCCDNTSSAVTVDGTAYLWGRVDGRKIVIPKIIETNISKIYLNSDSKFSILTTNGNFKLNEILVLFEMFITETILESQGIEDIFGSEVILKEDVYEVNEKKREIIKTNYSTFYEYFLYEKKEIKETIQITSDGYLKKPIIEFIDKKSKEILLKKTFVNIFDKKFENSFEIIDKIGEGGFGVVYKVKNKSTKNSFAIKRMQIKGDISETLKEIQIMSQMKSEFVVKYYNSWTEAKVIDKEIITFVYIQMELCSQNLESIIELINELTEEKFKTIKYFIRSELLIEIIECINYLHSNNIIHRDLKPQNILITNGINQRFLKLCDFGLSKVIESQNTRGVGTREFMAPEVYLYESYDPTTDRSNYNQKSDIYSLGVISTKLFDFNESIEYISELKSLEKYFNYYLNTHLMVKFTKLLDIILKMLSKTLEERPDCSELLAKRHEWTVDTNTVKTDDYYDFISQSEGDEKLKILISFLKCKTSVKFDENSDESSGEYETASDFSNE